MFREHRHELLDADLQHTLANSYSPEPGGHEPVEAGLLALATLLQAYCHVGDRDAVELTVMDKRWQMVLDCLGAEHPPSVRAPCLTSGCDSSPTTWTRPCWIGPSHWRSTPEASVPATARGLDSTPLFGADRVEDTLNLLGHALRKAVGLAAQALDTSAEVLVEDAGLPLVGHSSLKAALDLDWGSPAHAPARWAWSWRRWNGGNAGWSSTHLAAQTPPLQEVMETITQLIMQDTEPDPGWTGRATYQAARRT